MVKYTEQIFCCQNPSSNYNLCEGKLRLQIKICIVFFNAQLLEYEVITTEPDCPLSSFCRKKCPSSELTQLTCSYFGM